MDQTTRPSDRLRAPRRPWQTIGVVAALVVATSGIGAGAYAITQAVLAAPVAAPAAEPTPTEDPNLEPTASIAATVADLTVAVDSAASTDEDGTIVAYLWSFGDGTTATEATASHTYAAGGTFYVTLIVTDDAGATGSATSEVTVTAPPPPPPPPPPATTAGCPAGSFIAQGGSGVELLCMWDYCRNLTLPDPAYPECDSAFRP